MKGAKSTNMDTGYRHNMDTGTSFLQKLGYIHVGYTSNVKSICIIEVGYEII